MLVEALIEAVGASTTVTVVVAFLLASSFDVAVIVTLPAVPGAVHAPVLPLIAPPLAVQATVPKFPPLVVVLKVVELFTVRVGEAGLTGLTTTVCGVTSAESTVACCPPALVTVRVNVVGVVIASDDLATLLVTVPTPLLTLPFPPANALNRGRRLTAAP